MDAKRSGCHSAYCTAPKRKEYQSLSSTILAVLLDACAFRPKDTDSPGLSDFRPNFLICSFYKVFGDNPSGFGFLFVKKSTVLI
ncbi:hypothetical protein RND81_04G103200 [Saponaria officinalis]|uniref:Uncharacterized protein n=1 Tax=Saponaria officinalis TaxID=3572 RepID=A0AAW1LKL1_SAPOF